MDLLTPSVNVPAEREKLRRLRDEINSDAQTRLAHQRKYTARGFLRDMPALEAEGQWSDGSASASPVCAGSAVVIPSAEAKLPEAQAGCCGRCCGAGRMGEKGVKA